MRYLLIACLLVTIGCNSKGDLLKVKANVTGNPASQTLSLIAVDFGMGPVLLDTATLEAGSNTAELATALAEPAIYKLQFEREKRFILFVNDAPEITIDVDWNNLSAYNTSSAGSNALKGLLSITDAKLKEIDAAQAKFNLELNDSLRFAQERILLSQKMEFTQAVSGYIDTSRSSIVAIYALGFLNKFGSDTSLLNRKVKIIAKNFPGDPVVKNFSTTYFERAAKEARAILPGRTAPEFTLPDTTGQNISLSSFRGKYTLVDFWASWCGPCRDENPTIVKAYEAYKDKNFTVFGVSLDNNKEAWLKAIQKDGLTWTQVSDLKKWDSGIVELYDIQGIPFNVLLNPEGKVIAKNLTGNNLLARLAEELK